MARKKTAAQNFRHFNDLVRAVSGRDLRSWVDEGWAKFKETRVGNATGPLERAAQVMDPYQVLGLPREATRDQVEARRKQLAQIYHPDRDGGNPDAMKLVNNAADEILRKLKERKGAAPS